jgi:phosphohistidine phosphatase
MLRIFIVRHATAQEKGGSLPDFERSLVKKGEKEAVAVARHLSATYAAPDLMISSFANRAIETAHLFAKAFRYPRQKVLLRDTFYGQAGIDDLAAEIRKQPDKYKSLMVVGHDPALSRLAAHLVKDFRDTIPKAGVVVADFPARRWRDLVPGSGLLREFTAPDRLKDQKRKARNDLETKLVRAATAAFASVNTAAARAYQKEIRKSARRTVKGFLKKLGDRPRPSRPRTRSRPTA